jgi:long-chain alkane monooxygenase
VRARAVRHGRRGSDLIFLQGLWFVIGDTEQAARRREVELIEWVSVEGVLADLSGKLGVDLGDVELDKPVNELDVPGVQGIIDTLRDSGRPGGTFRDLAGRLLSARLVGTPEQIADQLEAWIRVGIDGVNVMDVPGHGAFADFARYLAPVLQARGLMQRDYSTGTLRQKLLGAHPRLPGRHPAAAHRARSKGPGRTPAPVRSPRSDPSR